MKTPHTITLYLSEDVQKFNAETGDYEPVNAECKKVRCLVSHISKAKAFQIYGDKENELISVRFEQHQPKFQKAVFNGETFKPIEELPNSVKHAIHLKKVQSG